MSDKSASAFIEHILLAIPKFANPDSSKLGSATIILWCRYGYDTKKC